MAGEGMAIPSPFSFDHMFDAVEEACALTKKDHSSIEKWIF
jgi:hypothetical protein